MEVQKHPHHVMHSKKWHEYLLEFFMLFLAVFLGFIAENIRENIVDKERAKEYALSLINDLQNDKNSIQQQIRFRETIYKNADSLMNLLKQDSFLLNPDKAAVCFSRMITRDIMATNRATIQELESSGSLRSFKNKRLVTQIVAYYNLLDEADDRIKYLFAYEAQALLPFQQEHYDMKYNDSIYRTQKSLKPFRKMDDEAQIQLYNITWRFGRLNKFLANNVLPHALKQADSLIQQCKKEFHLENE